MNNSSDKKGRKIASYIIPGIITLLVMVFVLIVKGIHVRTAEIGYLVVLVAGTAKRIYHYGGRHGSAG